MILFTFVKSLRMLTTLLSLSLHLVSSLPTPEASPEADPQFAGGMEVYMGTMMAAALLAKGNILLCRNPLNRICRIFVWCSASRQSVPTSEAGSPSLSHVLWILFKIWIWRRTSQRRIQHQWKAALEQ